MKTPLGCVISVALAVILSFAQEIALGQWNTFHSSTGFSVKYPDSWFPKGISKDRLMILSYRGGAEAMVIKRGQAVISVIEEHKYVNSTLVRLIDHYTQDTNVLLRRNIHNENAGNRGCRDLQEIVSKEGAVPPEDVPGPVPYIINTEYFCEVNSNKYVTVLRNFEGDERQALYQNIALRVAESLRAGK
jgi:hypothetical protein